MEVNAGGLLVVMYHYVRDVRGSRFPGIHAVGVDEFRRQVQELVGRCEVPDLEGVLAFLGGRYVPQRPLCLFTFDDGFAEHATTAAPILREYGAYGMFFLATACQEEGRVLPVHKNHFLMACLGFDAYRERFEKLLGELGGRVPAVDPKEARAAYRWDTLEVAAFKYVVNHLLSTATRDAVVSRLFEAELGSEAEFAASLYLDWDQAAGMERDGMLIGGHTHTHSMLAAHPEATQRDEIATCARLLTKRLSARADRPFAYPFGKAHTFDHVTERLVEEAGFACAFSTETGMNTGVGPRFAIRRLDPKDVVSRAL
jgi:peptidoglycan/xylan/chitin deacetylase (PgdA/CDA1 family)